MEQTVDESLAIGRIMGILSVEEVESSADDEKRA
jgi:hypothetical protein